MESVQEAGPRGAARQWPCADVTTRHDEAATQRPAARSRRAAGAAGTRGSFSVSRMRARWAPAHAGQGDCNGRFAGRVACRSRRRNGTPHGTGRGCSSPAAAHHQNSAAHLFRAHAVSYGDGQPVEVGVQDRVRNAVPGEAVRRTLWRGEEDPSRVQVPVIAARAIVQEAAINRNVEAWRRPRARAPQRTALARDARGACQAS